MVDDLLDIGAEALVTTAEAVAVTRINPDNETPEIKKKKKHGLISGIFMIILIAGLIYVMFWRWGIFNELSINVDEFGIISLLIAFGLALLIMLIMGIASYLKKKDKELKKIYVFIGLSGLCTAAVVIGMYPSMELSNPLHIIPIIGFTFGITLMFFMLFHKIGDVKINQVLRLPYHLLIKFFIPMMFICFLILGAMQGKYGYDSVFLKEVEIQMFSWFGEVFGGAIYGTIEVVFNMAAGKPDFFLFISGAVALYLLYSAIRYSFWGDKWPFMMDDDKNKLQDYIDEADDKFLSKEDLESFNRGKLRLEKKYLDGYKNKEIQGGKK